MDSGGDGSTAGKDPIPGINVPVGEPGCTRRTYQDVLDYMVPWHPPDSPSQVEGQKQADTATEKQICDALQLDVLGRMEDGSVKVFSIFHKRSAVIKNPSKMAYEDFLQIVGPPAKACLLKSRVDDNVPGMWSCEDAKGAVQILAGYRTLSDELELGPGCWKYESGEVGIAKEDAIVIVNSDEAAIYNGQLRKVEHPRAGNMLLDFSVSGKHWCEYETLEKNLEKAANPQFRLDLYRDSLELFGKWQWAFQNNSPAVMTGLCLATWVQHLWFWRPQIAIIGPSKSGKSMLSECLAGLFRGNCILASDTTAAGLRQQIENSMPAVIVDEADPKDRGQQAERRKILAMIRQSSRGGLVLRGSSNQKAVKHTLRHLFWIFGIQLPFDDEADRNRVIMLELKPAKVGLEGKLHLPPSEVLANLGQRMLAAALWSIRLARDLAAKIRDMRMDGVDSRAIESYAVPAAILAVVHGFAGDETETKKLLVEILAEASASDQPQAMHDSLMQEIFSAKVQMGGERPSVGQCLERVDSKSAGSGEAEVVLAGVGVKIGYGRSGRCLLLQYQPVAKHLLRGTRWEGAAIDQLLRSIPEALRAKPRIGGVQQRGVEIPWEVVAERYLGDERPTQEEF